MKAHPFDLGAFVLAMTAIGVAAVFFFGPQDGTMQVAWLLPVGLIALGIAGVSAFIRFLRHRDDRAEPMA